MRFPRNRILIFAKAPVPGSVKTRLLPVLSPEGAAALYRELLETTVSTVCSSALAGVDLWCAPDTLHPVFRSLEKTRGVALFRQSGGDLGSRMAWAATRALASADSVLLIGGDCPELDPDYLETALRWLAEGDDAVLGPAEDGGYVLIGLRRNNPRLFEDIPWGGDRVLELTRERLRELGWRWRELTPLWDLDRPEDLHRYRSLQA